MKTLKPFLMPREINNMFPIEKKFFFKDAVRNIQATEMHKGIISSQEILVKMIKRPCFLQKQNLMAIEPAATNMKTLAVLNLMIKWPRFLQ